MKNYQSGELFSHKWQFVVILSLLALFLLFAVVGDPGRGRAAAISLGSIVVAARLRWDLKKYVWFWITLVVVAGLHIPLILLIPWTSRSYPGVVLLPTMLVDCAIVYGCIKLAEKVMKARQQRQYA